MKKNSNNNTLLISCIIVFFITLIVSLVVKNILIPYIYPSELHVNGFIVGDSKWFNSIAINLSQKIQINGWGDWLLRPNGFSPSGIVSIIYTLFGINSDLIIIFNSVIHTFTFLVIVILLQSFFDLKSAIIGGLIFISNPQCLEWVSQLHRDGIFVLGNMLFILQILKLIANNYVLVKLIFYIILSSLLVWIARPYWISVLVILLFISIIFNNIKNINFIKLKPILIVYIISFSFLHILLKSGSPVMEIQMTSTPSRAESKQVDGRALGQKAQKVIISNEEGRTKIIEPIINNEGRIFTWERTEWLPNYIDNKIHIIGATRYSAIRTGGSSLIDEDILFENSTDVFIYLLRGLFIGLFSPFPDLWFGDGNSSYVKYARPLMGLFTIFYYFGIFLFIFFIIKYFRKNYNIIYLSIASIFSITLFSISYPNIGTLMRFRYGYYMLIISIGFAYLNHLLTSKDSIDGR